MSHCWSNKTEIVAPVIKEAANTNLTAITRALFHRGETMIELVLFVITSMLCQFYGVCLKVFSLRGKITWQVRRVWKAQYEGTIWISWVYRSSRLRNHFHVLVSIKDWKQKKTILFAVTSRSFIELVSSNLKANTYWFQQHQKRLKVEVLTWTMMRMSKWSDWTWTSDWTQSRRAPHQDKRTRTQRVVVWLVEVKALSPLCSCYSEISLSLLCACADERERGGFPSNRAAWKGRRLESCALRGGVRDVSARNQVSCFSQLFLGWRRREKLRTTTVRTCGPRDRRFFAQPPSTAGLSTAKPGAGLRLDEPEEGQWIWLVGCPWLFPTQHSTRSLSLHTPFRIKRENRRKKETAYSRTPTVLTSAPDSAVRDGSCALLLIRRHDYFRLFLYISFPSRPASNNGVVRRTTGGILSSCLSLSLFVCLRRLTVRSVFVCLILTGTD